MPTRAPPMRQNWAMDSPVLAGHTPTLNIRPGVLAETNSLHALPAAMITALARTMRNAGLSSVVSRASTPPMPPPGAGSISSTGEWLTMTAPALRACSVSTFFWLLPLYLRNTLGLPGKAWPSNSQPPFLPSFMSMPHECHISMISRLRSREASSTSRSWSGPTMLSSVA